MLSRYVSSKETMFVQSDASLTQLQTKQLTAKHTGNLKVIMYKVQTR